MLALRADRYQQKEFLAKGLFLFCNFCFTIHLWIWARNALSSMIELVPIKGSANLPGSTTENLSFARGFLITLPIATKKSCLVNDFIVAN